MHCCSRESDQAKGISDKNREENQAKKTLGCELLRHFLRLHGHRIVFMQQFHVGDLINESAYAGL